MADEKNELKFVEITRATRLKGKAVAAEKILRVGVDISLSDAGYLVGICKAKASDGKPSKEANKGDSK